MINFQEEIRRFKPSLDVDNIEDAIAGIDLTDMTDLMMQLVENAADTAAKKDSDTDKQNEI
ncbi:MAG: hypothetical protein MR011_08410 [Lachnospiraceae bacterium]|nr:hypothetical protein [Lachnospiraceae bacterium]